jgi:hypothetical protein
MIEVSRIVNIQPETVQVIIASTGGNLDNNVVYQIQGLRFLVDGSYLLIDGRIILIV